MKKFMAVFLSVCMLLTLVACGNGNTQTNDPNSPNDGGSDSADAGNTYILGVQQPLSGDNAVAGQIAVNAIELFVKLANENGGWNGEQIKTVVYDDQSSPEEAVKVANKLIESDKADAVIASLLSSNVLASAGYLDEAGILTFGIGTSPTWMQQGWEHVYRACHSSDLVIPSLANKMEELEMGTVAIFKGEDDSSVSGYEDMLPELESRGIEVVSTTTYTTGDTDFSGQIAAMIDSGADCIYMSTQGTILASFMKQLRSFGFEGLVFSKENFTTDQLEVAGQNANGYIFASAYVTYGDVSECPNEMWTEMYNLYYEEYGEYPAQDNAFRAWDSMLVLQEAIRIAGSTETADIEAAIETISGLETLAGTVDYTDGTREGLHAASCYAVEDGKFIQVDTWIADGGADAYLK